ncbi:MAG: hypothetical protein UV09_C0020G0001, partial [Candidatus Gottesmanbacteria bacterium GW2011_GWA2_42_18]
MGKFEKTTFPCFLDLCFPMPYFRNKKNQLFGQKKWRQNGVAEVSPTVGSRDENLSVKKEKASFTKNVIITGIVTVVIGVVGLATVEVSSQLIQKQIAISTGVTGQEFAALPQEEALSADSETEAFAETQAASLGSLEIHTGEGDLFTVEVSDSPPPQVKAARVSTGLSQFASVFSSIVDYIKSPWAGTEKKTTPAPRKPQSGTSNTGTQSNQPTQNTTTGGFGTSVTSNTAQGGQATSSPAGSSQRVITPARKSTTTEDYLSVNTNLELSNNLQVVGDATIKNSATIGGTGIVQGNFTARAGAIVNGAFRANSASTFAGVSTFSRSVQALGGVNTTGADIDAGTGRVFASNLVNSVKAGSNITISGDPRNPTISAKAASATAPVFYGGGSAGVSSLQGSTGALTLTGGGGISVSGLTISLGTVGVASGGTGQTSFGQGWLHSDGTTITSSTSPTVAYVTATSTTATSTFANGINVSAGCFSLNGTCLASGSGTPGGSSGQIQYNNGGSFGGASGFVWDSTTARLGLGTSSPWAKLSLQGTYGSQDPLFDIASSTATNGTATSSVFRVNANGNVGIGTTSPWARLSVTGNSDLGNYALAGYFVATTTATSTFGGAITVGAGQGTSTFAGGLQANVLSVISTTASSTFANGIQITGGCYARPDGTCMGVGNGITSLNGLIVDSQTFTNDTNVTITSGGSAHALGWTGSLAVARGGTGQTSFGQGWLHSDGTTITSSTSPTVAYVTA